MKQKRNCRVCGRGSRGFFFCKPCWNKLPEQMRLDIGVAIKSRFAHVDDLNRLDMAVEFLKSEIEFDSKLLLEA